MKQIGYSSYTLGYIFTNLSDAQEYGPDAVPLYHYRYGNYGASSGKDIDDFYTINPAGEINLVDNPIPCRKPLDREYQYVGIVGYVYPADAPGAPQETVIDVGKLGPTGQCVDKTGWYAFDNETGPFNWRVYNRGGQHLTKILLVLSVLVTQTTQKSLLRQQTLNGHTDLTVQSREQCLVS